MRKKGHRLVIALPYLTCLLVCFACFASLLLTFLYLLMLESENEPKLPYELIKALRETINREQARHHYNLSQVLLAVSVIYNELLILLMFNICQQYPKIIEALKDSNSST